MALPATLDGPYLYIKVGDGATPTEAFAHPCLINEERGVSFTSQGNDVYTPDCSDPLLPAIREHIITAVQMAVTGAGKLDTAALSAYLAWWKAGTSKNVQVWFGTLGYVQAAMKLTTFDHSGARGDKVAANVALESTGAIGDWTAA
jgi:hypothetical protein